MAAQHSRRPSFRACGALAALALACAAPAARGQAPNSPHAGYAYPAGGQQGTSVQVAVGGRFLEGASGAVFTAQGPARRDHRLRQAAQPA